MTTNDNEWQRVATNDNEWYNEWQWVTTNDNKWQRVIKRVITNDNEWQGVVQQIKTLVKVKESNFDFRMKQNMQCSYNDNILSNIDYL